jgi:hypothetical protein
MGCSLEMTTPLRLAATWPLLKPPGIHPLPHPIPGPFKALRYLPPPSTSHSNSVVHLPWELCNSCIFMAPCRSSFTSLHLSQWILLLLDVMGSPEPQLLASISKRQLSRALVPLRLIFELWCDSSWAPLRFWRSPLTMPRPRGKPKRGAAWYLARGRKPSASDIPDDPVNPHEAFPAAFPEVPDELPAAPTPEALLVDPPPGASPPPEEAPPLAPILVDAQNQPPCDLSPLSNPYGCRVEWFDLHGNSLGFAPPPPSPPRFPFTSPRAPPPPLLSPPTPTPPVPGVRTKQKSCIT